MKTFVQLSLFIGIFTVLAAGVASAEVISGTVQNVNPETESFTLAPSNTGADSDVSRPVQVSLTNDANLNGIRTLDELEIGDQVTLEAELEAPNEYGASSLILTETPSGTAMPRRVAVVSTTTYADDDATMRTDTRPDVHYTAATQSKLISGSSIQGQPTIGAARQAGSDHTQAEVRRDNSVFRADV